MTTIRYSFDGKGINDATNPYKSRIATFANSEAAQKHGKLMEAAPELLGALEMVTAVLGAMRPSGVYEEAVQRATNLANVAIAKARG